MYIYSSPKEQCPYCKFVTRVVNEKKKVLNTLFGDAPANPNISIIQRSQSEILRMIANAPWYVPNTTLHEDLNVPLVKEVIKQRSTRYHNKIEGHVDVLIKLLLQPHNQRTLKRNWPADLRER
jgi:glutaredoxin